MKGKKIIIDNIVDNIFHRIINHNLLMIHIIMNHNFILTTNVDIIIRIEEHNKLVPKMNMMETKWENMAIFVVEYLHKTKKLSIIPFGKKRFQDRKTQLILLRLT